MNSYVNERIEKLRHMMMEVGINAVLVPTSDCHDGEFVAPHFALREYLSGFTGSAGTLLVFEKEAYLFTDGRYFIQAEEELSGTGIELMKMGNKGVPKIEDFLVSKLSTGENLALDGRLISGLMGEKFKKSLEEKGCTLTSEVDFIYDMWTDRPLLIHENVFVLDNKYAGEDTEEKLKRLREAMKKREADSHIITTLDDIAWLLNLRGNDIPYCPVFLSYMVITQEEAILYADINEESEAYSYLIKKNIKIREYNSFYEEGIKSVNNCTHNGVLLDKSRVNYSILKSLTCKVINGENPTTEFKAVKNSVEIENIDRANIIDGVAMVRFEKWLKESVLAGETITELSVEEKLLEFRKLSGEMIEPSFKTIAAYGSHGAIVHYEASTDSDVRISEGSFLMVDSGGHYLHGTTDVTRTYSIGNVKEKLKQDYTLVLRGMLRIMNAVFMKGTKGAQIDMLCRPLFWEKGLDFKHGTGHGIGYLLNVHEGPVRISWGGDSTFKFEPGMLVSDEPGIYIKDSHGVRIENDIICEEAFENEYGHFLKFRPVTYVPIDKNAIFIDDMTDEDIAGLNEYHKLVYDKLSPYLNEDEVLYLKEVTSPVKK